MYMMESYLDSNVDKEQGHTVVWSGGCDSTLLLKTIAERYGTFTNPIIAISLEHSLIDEKKRELETQARDKLLKEFTNRGLHIKHKVITISCDIGYGPVTAGQAYLWLSTIIPFAANMNLYLGFIKEDSVWHYMSQLQNLISNINNALSINTLVHYPLEHITKHEIIDKLYKENLYDLVWYCEAPKTDIPCGKCTPCETHTHAIVKLALQDREWAIGKLPKKLKYVKKYADWRIKKKD